MILGLVAALGAAAVFGIAAVLQGLATEGAPDGDRLDPRLLLRLLRRPLFVAALACNGLGLVLHVRALQDLPLFLVQAVIASSVAVTAVVSVRAFGVALTRPQWAAVGAVVLGLTLLAPSAVEGEVAQTTGRTAAVLLAAMVAVVVASVAAGHLHGAPGAVLLGLLGGVGFGIVAVCARLLPGLAPAELVRAPVTYVMAFSGVLAFLLYSSAMQKGSVTVTTAALVVPQTAVPALVGTLLLGDEVRPGFGIVATIGFALALAGAVGLARFEGGAAAPGPSRGSVVDPLTGQVPRQPCGGKARAR